MSSLRNTITQLASQFAAGVLNAIRGASLEDILAETRGGGGGGAAARRSAVSEDAVVAATPKARRGRGGRLSRRSAGDIAGVVDRIVALLQQHPKGLRSEDIREKLGLEAKELPRPISEALSSKKISKQGHKRATTYFAGGRSAPAAKAAGKAGKKGGGARAAKTTKRAAKAKGAKGGKKAGASAAANGTSAASAEGAA